MPGKWFPTNWNNPPIPLGPTINQIIYGIPIDATLDLTEANSRFTLINPTDSFHLKRDTGAQIIRYYFNTSKALPNNALRTLLLVDGFELPTRLTEEEDDKTVLARVSIQAQIGAGNKITARGVSAIVEDYFLRGEDEGFPNSTNIAISEVNHGRNDGVTKTIGILTANKQPLVSFLPIPGAKTKNEFLRGTLNKGGTHRLHTLDIDQTFLIGRNNFTSKIDGTNPYFMAGVAIEAFSDKAFSSDTASAIILSGSWVDITIAAYTGRIPVLDPRAY